MARDVQDLCPSLRRKKACGAGARLAARGLGAPTDPQRASRCCQGSLLDRLARPAVAFIN